MAKVVREQGVREEMAIYGRGAAKSNKSTDRLFSEADMEEAIKASIAEQRKKILGSFRSNGKVDAEYLKDSDDDDEDQRFCMYQYERGTRTTNPFCQIENCEPPVSDPCSRTELARCKCEDFSCLFALL